MNDRRRYLDFEQALLELDTQIEKLKSLKLRDGSDLSNEIRILEEKSAKELKAICAKLSPYQKVQLSRHPDRPNLLYYIESIFTDFFELHGDRAFRDDPAIVGGIASLDGQTVMIIGQQKGKGTQENVHRNFGMPRPEGYRKALRLMKMAERFEIPLLTFIDTPGAYPGIDAEERGQAEAIAHNIIEMCGLKTPIISTILGEGGSGGALAIGVADRVLMFEYSTYSVISPEGCAAIIYKDGAFAPQAAESLKLDAESIRKTGVADEIIPEPLGGAHRKSFDAATSLKKVLLKHVEELTKQPIEKVLEARYARYRKMGRTEKDEIQKPLVITIDGPAGSGKSTVAKHIAREMGLPYIDTGAMYRAVAHKALQQSVDLSDEPALVKIAETLEFRFEIEAAEFSIHLSESGGAYRRLGGEIRTPEISMASSKIAQLKDLRKVLVRKQQKAGEFSGGVLEGRDAGTVIFPHAQKKFFVFASPEVRAKRRHFELTRRMGVEAPTFQTVLSELNLRDRQDGGREASPMKPAEDALLVDTSDMDENQVFESLLQQIQIKAGKL